MNEDKLVPFDPLDMKNYRIIGYRKNTIYHWWSISHSSIYINLLCDRYSVFK